MLKKINHHDKEPTYRSQETDIEYDMFKAGFSWPIEGRHGYICVIALETDSKKLRVVAEYKENGFTALSRRLKVLNAFYDIRFWITPVEADFESYLESLYKICKQEDYRLKCSNPTLADDLQLCAHLITRELDQNSLILPAKGMLIRDIPKLKNLDLDDHSKMAKMQPAIVAARIIFEFPSIDKRIEKDQKQDGWAEGFEDKEVTDWMAM